MTQVAKEKSVEYENESLGVSLNNTRGETYVMVSGKKDIPKLVLREEEAEISLSLSKGSLSNRWDEESTSYDPSFPAPISLGEGGERRGAIGWRFNELAHWVNTRPRVVKNKKRQRDKHPKYPKPTLKATPDGENFEL